MLFLSGKAILESSPIDDLPVEASCGNSLPRRKWVWIFLGSFADHLSDVVNPIENSIIYYGVELY